METVLTLTRTVPYLLRRSLQAATQSLPPSPGGRPQELRPEQRKEICLQIGQLYGQGIELRDAQKRMAQRYGVSLRTIQRAWQERGKWNSTAYQEKS
jgi:DNA invertase Pin-like site-specific DNA recombinase